jgi:hypothetical protein
MLSSKRNEGAEPGCSSERADCALVPIKYSWRRVTEQRRSLGGVTIATVNYQTKTKHMTHKVIRIIGVLLLVLGAALIILQLRTGEKPVIKSLAKGATPITMGALLIGVSRRKKASGDPSDTTKR